MKSVESVMLYKFRNAYGTGYTFNPATARRDGNKPLGFREVELPEGVVKLSTRYGIVLKNGEDYAPVPLQEGGNLVALFHGAGRITLCECF